MVSTRIAAIATAAAAIALAATPTLAASNIDQGFALDGSTTYCQGIKPGINGVVPGLADLPVDSAGKCPVGVSIVPPAKVKKGEKVAFSWKAKTNAGVQNNRFPSSVDVASKVPKAVQASWLKACKAGTNCATVIDSTATGPATAESGPFDATGSRDMRTSEFTFNEAAEYVVIGKVMLPGDESLGLGSIEYITMLKFKVEDASPTPTPTPSAATPGPSTATPSTTNSSASHNASSSLAGKTVASNEESVVKGPATKTDPTTGTVKPGSDEIAGSSKSGGSSSLDANTASSKGIFGANSVLLGCVLAGCFVAFVMGFAFVMRRRSESKMAIEKHSAPDTGGSVGMLDSGEFGSAKYVETVSSRNQESRPKMSVSPPPVVFDASVRGSEMNLSAADEYEVRDMSEVSSLASEAYSDTISNFDDASRPTDDNYLGSFDWKESEDSRQSNFSIASKARGFSTSSALSDLSEGPRESRLASEVSVDSYAFAPSPRSSAADSYAGGYSESSRISGLSMYSDVSSVHD